MTMRWLGGRRRDQVMLDPVCHVWGLDTIPGIREASVTLTEGF